MKRREAEERIGRVSRAGCSRMDPIPDSALPELQRAPDILLQTKGAGYWK